jgi:hypothetical protein
MRIIGKFNITLIISFLFSFFVGYFIVASALDIQVPVSANEGYFTRIDFSGTGIDNVILSCTKAGDPAIPSSVTNKATFITKIKEYLNGCGVATSSKNEAQVKKLNKIGAAFIIKTMMGARPDKSTDFPVVSSKDLSTWESLINQDEIEIGYMPAYSLADGDYNSGYIGSSYPSTPDEIYRPWSAMTFSALVFRDTTRPDGEQVVYMLKISCANPIGALPGIVPDVDVKKNWSISPFASVSVNGTIYHSSVPTVHAGDKVVWRHRVRNDGPDIAPNLTYHWESTNGIDRGDDISVSNLSPSIYYPDINQDPSIYEYVVPSDRPAGMICHKTVVSPGSVVDDVVTLANKPSSVACVNLVISPPEEDASGCRPIEVKVELKSYSGGSVTANYPDNSGSKPTITWGDDNNVPVEVSINGTTIGTYRYNTTLDLTQNYTTGDSYRAKITETRDHITGYNETTGQFPDGQTCTGSGETETCTPKYKTLHTGWDAVTSRSSWYSQSWQCYDYILVSSVKDFGSYLEPGSPITVSPWADNSSYTSKYSQKFFQKYGIINTKSKNTRWEIIQMNVDPGFGFPPSVAAGVSSSEPCAYFDPSNSFRCTKAESGDHTFTKNGQSSPGVYRSTVPDSPAGTKICFAFSIRPSQSDPANSIPIPGGSDQWVHASFNNKKNCITVAKKPKVQIWGGDLWAGGNVVSSSSVKNSGTFGSWVEYGILTVKNIAGTASGSAFAGTNGGSPSINTCGYSTLSFANSACSGGTMGGYVNSHSIPNVEASLSDMTFGASINVSGGSLSL